jgi:hypothetical protein
MEQIDNTSRKYQLDLSILPNYKDIPRFRICDKTVGTLYIKNFNMLSKNLTRVWGRLKILISN